jgi:TatA/E family protein of Tat protein translocase
MLGMLSDTGILVLVIAVVLLFGTSQIPKLARNLAEAGKEFRQAHAEVESETRPVVSPQIAVSAAPTEEKITLTRSELDVLLAGQRTQSVEPS